MVVAMRVEDNGERFSRLVSFKLLKTMGMISIIFMLICSLICLRSVSLEGSSKTEGVKDCKILASSSRVVSPNAKKSVNLAEIVVETTTPTEKSKVRETEKPTISPTEPQTEVPTEWYDNTNFENSIRRSDVPNYAWGEEIATFSCESLGIKDMPIIYGWTQYLCDTNDIVMDPHTGAKFGDNKAIFICGHDYKGMGSKLPEMKIGDKFLIKTRYCANFLYEVTYSKMAKLDEDSDSFYGMYDLDTWQHALGRWDETKDVGIFTCYANSDAGYRWFVKGKLVKGTKVN